ncbi:regulator of sigma E protease [Bartonella sp. CDC_skunk]|uniref:Uncharacterized protein n=1 Tax=Bartonella rochalimae ATCC BAA-1498 TaxID=685782 RepID=A0A067WJG9_9HYPH|nr:regulator of sigma E protease [Bartonella sp. CDC_skunk]AQX26493.1 regulator of sigma E protease [Bartonella sp. Raccoon60]KEC56943.1 hypothetical protein O99_00365 [Bartonella rochalimae ATCC BAA-1498]
MIGVRVSIVFYNSERLDPIYKKHICYNWIESIAESLKSTTLIIIQKKSFLVV